MAARFTEAAHEVYDAHKMAPPRSRWRGYLLEPRSRWRRGTPTIFDTHKMAAPPSGGSGSKAGGSGRATDRKSPCRRPEVAPLRAEAAAAMGEKKASGRVPEAAQRRVLDRAARQRRLSRQLEALENDNFGDDPQAGLPRPGKRLPHFADTAETGKKKKKTRGDHFKLRFRKNFQALLEEQNLSASEGPNYVTACAAPSRLPPRHFCAVCGFPCGYACAACGARFCSPRCLGTHHDTRCLKWTV
ncbi:zinc finger HIT domain-containing protein 1 [Phaenicophaeus curvirostris]|uniref:zinc finger HIT domain-containing protein 1 n=1 Tax=Phaenicophaeus curvirostris TaxID=33595 RepID=UPI0037F09A89